MKYEKKSFILKAGETCRAEGFILNGCCRTYYLNEDGHEILLNFAIEDWWVDDLISFHERKPSQMYIETLETTDLLFLTPSKKKELLDRFPALERMFRLMVQKHLATYQQRIYNNFALDAERRYDQFIERHGHFVNRIPLYMIASYLGISLESLSRIRKRKSTTCEFLDLHQFLTGTVLLLL